MLILSSVILYPPLVSYQILMIQLGLVGCGYTSWHSICPAWVGSWAQPLVLHKNKTKTLTPRCSVCILEPTSITLCLEQGFLSDDSRSQKLDICSPEHFPLFSSTEVVQVFQPPLQVGRVMWLTMGTVT